MCDMMNDIIQPKDIWYCEFRFRGTLCDIKELTDFFVEKNIKDYVEVELNNSIVEIRVRAEEITNELVKKFPRLKVTGLCENSRLAEVMALYSESGFDYFTSSVEVGNFSPKDDEGSGRWANEIDLLNEYYGDFIDVRTGTKIYVSYEYPFQNLWNNCRNIIGYIPEDSDEFENDFEIIDGVLKYYYGTGGEVIIPDNVKEIASKVFKENVQITSVTIPGSIDYIDIEAFAGCRKLKKIILHEGVKCIGEFSFCECDELVEVIFSESLEMIESAAFWKCVNLDVSKLVFPIGLQEIGYGAFEECKNVPEEMMISDD